MHRLLTPRVHSVIDYALVVVLLLAPSILGFDGLPAGLCYALAVIHFAMTVSAHPLGIFDAVPFGAHGRVEAVVAPLLCVTPFLLGFSDDRPACDFFIVAGIVVAAVWALTNYSAERPEEGDQPTLKQRQHI